MKAYQIRRKNSDWASTKFYAKRGFAAGTISRMVDPKNYELVEFDLTEVLAIPCDQIRQEMEERKNRRNR